MEHPIVIVFKKGSGVDVVFHPTQREVVDSMNLDISQDSPGFLIVPKSKVLRMGFRFVRLLFGRAGRMADWTRKWTCSWVAIDCNTRQVLGEFASHKLAVDFEIVSLLRED